VDQGDEPGSLRFLASAAVGCVLSACGGGGGYGYYGGGQPGGGGGPPNGGGTGGTTQYVAPTDNVFVAATDPNNPGITYGPTQGEYAGARLFITATVVAGQPTTSNQAQYAQMYKANDGHLYSVNLVAIRFAASDTGVERSQCHRR
jgi:hypothetical protein